jgi:capsular exopolysaccharide synthesis family protein
MNNGTMDQPMEALNRAHVMSPREIIIKYLPYLPWVLVALAISLTVAFVKLRYAANVYQVRGTMLVKESSSSSGRPDKLEELIYANPNKNLNDEIQVVRSRNLAKRVVKSLGLEVQYFNEGNIRSSQLVAAQSPFYLEIRQLQDSLATFSLRVFLIDDRSFSLEEKGAPLKFGQAFENRNGSFSLQRNPSIDTRRFASREFQVTYAPPDGRAGQLVGALSASASGESNNIMQLTYNTENTALGIQIVNQWMDEYKEAGREEKQLVAVNAIDFINDQMVEIRKELGTVERNLLALRQKNRVISPEQQSTIMFSTLNELEKEITTKNVQVRVVDNLIAYIGDNSNPYRQVGSALGIEEPSLNAQITEFNRLQVQRETLLKSTTRANPLLVDAEAAIEKLRQDILQNMRNIRQAYEVALKDLNLRNREAGKAVESIPAKEKEILDVARQQKILEELFSYLLQKKLETSIGSASTISNVRVIEPAMASSVPVTPNRRNTYIMALLVGLLIPAALIFLIEYLNDKIRSRDDIQRGTDTPIIGEVGHSDEKGVLVVTRSSRRFISEQFRIIRTNLQYVLPKQDKSVIMVTSSTSGEGKSFISVNMGAAMSLAGKKTAIMEFDIRKPKVMVTLGLAKQSGITNYIIGKTAYEDLAVPVPGYENLVVIPCGPVPPNPAELLLDERLNALMERLKADYDVIVIDTAPVGLVSDAVTLGHHADATLYVVRHGYTFRKQLQLLDDMHRNKRLPKLSIVINDIRAEGGYGHYYGYGGYGYTGYGYGYGSEYFDDKKPSRNLFTEAFRRFLHI